LIMSSTTVRVLLVADTHLGFDLPFRPRIQRRRRGHDFFANFEQALLPAIRGEADLVVHGGDLFYRSKVPAALVEMAMAPLGRVAEQGVPVYLVPGNHERSRIPLHLWASHPNIHIFDEPRTFVYSQERFSMALSGFPFTRMVRDRFVDLVHQAGHDAMSAEIHILCMHQAVEGAQVGASNYTFRQGHDVVRGRSIPRSCAAVLSGHIHRAQVLTHDLSHRPLAAPVIYPGAVERTSFAERNEDKGYMLVNIELPCESQRPLVEASFVPLPARPMVMLTIEPRGIERASVTDHLKRQLAALEPDSVVQLQLSGRGSAEAREILTTPYLRELAPPSMNIWLAPDRTLRRRNRGKESSTRPGAGKGAADQASGAAVARRREPAPEQDSGTVSPGTGQGLGSRGA
jgi:DNA repair exonuclease SbcCD nuclease subunit